MTEAISIKEEARRFLGLPKEADVATELIMYQLFLTSQLHKTRSELDRVLQTYSSMSRISLYEKCKDILKVRIELIKQEEEKSEE